MKKSLGLIETEGLAAGIEAADAAVKSANVELIGYELTKGGGWTTIKVQGDVGAVKAAVDAARMAAAKITRVVSTRVIPRPSAGLDILVHNLDTVGDVQTQKGPDMPKPPTPPKGPKKVKEELPTEPNGQETEQMEEAQPVSVTEQADKIVETPEASAEDSKEAKADGVEALVEASEPEASVEDSKEAEVSETEKAPEPEASVEDSKEAEVSETEKAPEPDSIEAPAEKSQDAGHSEEEDGELPPEPEPAAPKPTKRATASKGRKGGKRGSKHETTE